MFDVWPRPFHNLYPSLHVPLLRGGRGGYSIGLGVNAPAVRDAFFPVQKVRRTTTASAVHSAGRFGDCPSIGLARRGTSRWRGPGFTRVRAHLERRSAAWSWPRL